MTPTASRGRAPRIPYPPLQHASPPRPRSRPATDGSFAAGLNLNFSLDSSRGGFKLTSQRLATTGTVEARVYRDLNDNGVRDLAEPWEEGATDHHRPARVGREHRQKGRGPRRRAAAVSRPIAVGIDTVEPGRSDARAEKGAAGRRPAARRRRARSKSAWSAPATSKACWSRTTAAASKGLDIELLDATGKVVATDAKRLRRLLPVRTGRLWPLSASPDR